MEKIHSAVLLFVLILDLLPFLVQAQQRPRIIEHPADALAARDEPLTLNCKAAGRPSPEISWYHNGAPLVPSERRVILPEGSLFFLRVMQNKREQDAGVYWCEAKSSAGVAVSRNATLQIAVLRDDFRSIPKDAVALVGGPVVLNCTPPRGIPEPSVLWLKDGKLLDLSGKRLSVESGSLMISEVQASDAGKYECSAQSMAGSKTAPPAYLKVIAPPIVVKGPQDTEVIEGEGLDLPCELTGDPKPTVSWHRENGNLPDGRSRVLLDNTLRIEETRPEDQGRYICRGHNEGGNVTIAVKLFVYAIPTFIESPSDSEVREGNTIKIPCRAQGRPNVRIVWDRISYISGNGGGGGGGGNGGSINQAATTVTEEVSKFLEQETHEELLAKAKIMSLRSKREKLLAVGETEKENDDTPKATKNTNLTVALRKRRRRRKRNVILVDEVQSAGDDDHQIPDLYIDESVSRDKRDQDQDFLLSEFKQIMRDENQESYDTTFKKRKRRKKRDAQDGSAAIPDDDDPAGEGEEEEEIEEDNGEGAADGASDSTPEAPFSTPLPVDQQLNLEVLDNGELVIRDASSKDQGWYACGALNEAGGIVKKIYLRVMHTGDTSPDAKPIKIPDIPGSRWGSDQNIVINSIVQISSTALDINWDTSDGVPSTSLTLHYRPIGGKDFQTAATQIDVKEYTLTELKPHTEYEIFITAPQGLGGSVSNIRTGKTMDGPPSAPPTDVRVGVINNTAAYVRWSPPPSHLLNGELIGYKIQIKSNVTNKVLGQMSLNATTQSVVINSLSPGGRYVARVAPLTAGGIGPFSPPTPLHMDPSFIVRPPRTDPTSNGWASAWMSAIALGILGICLVGGAIFAVFWARRNKRNMKASYPGPVLTTTIPDKQHTLWLHGNPMIVKATHSLAQTMPTQHNSEYAEVTNQSGLPTVKLNTNSAPPEPYATVTLKRNGQQSEESCVKCSSSPSSSDYNHAPVTREPLNLCDILPPPPDHPYGVYKPPNNMTIRTNPAAMSPQVLRRIPPTPPRWGTLPPPIPNFPQNWMQQRHIQNNLDNGHPHHDMYSENDYESGSILYEQCCRPQDANSYFSHGGEPTEEYYRNVNMEFYDEQNYEPSTPPPPCPDISYNNKMNTNLRLLVNNQMQQQQLQDSPMNTKRINRNQNNFGVNGVGGGGGLGGSIPVVGGLGLCNGVIMNGTCTIGGGGGGSGSTNAGSGGSGSTPSANSSDESESDNNRWAPRSRRSRSRSKSSDRKYRNVGNNVGQPIIR